MYAKRNQARKTLLKKPTLIVFYGIFVIPLLTVGFTIVMLEIEFILFLKIKTLQEIYPLESFVLKQI